MFLLPTRQLVA